MISRLLSKLALAALTPAANLTAPKACAVAFDSETLPTGVQVYACAAGNWSGPDPDALVSGGRAHYESLQSSRRLA